MKYLRKVYFKNQVFFITKNVYEPAEDTFLLAENMKVEENDVVLDMGTGCGILSILAAKKSKKVIAVDINPFAIKCAKFNAKKNGVKEIIDFRVGDLFQEMNSKDEIFSLILFNAPYLPSESNEEENWLGKAWAGGFDGRKIINNFISNVWKFLINRGRILMVQSSLSNIDNTFNMFNEAGLKARIMASVKVPFEKIVLIEVKFDDHFYDGNLNDYFIK